MMWNIIIHDLIKLNHNTITVLINIIKHVTENETFTVFLMKFENMLTEMTTVYEKHLQFLLSDQCSKYCLSFNLSDESFMNLITDLIEKCCMLSFNISFFKSSDTKMIFTVYERNTVIIKADIAEMRMIETLKMNSESDKMIFELWKNLIENFLENAESQTTIEWLSCKYSYWRNSDPEFYKNIHWACD